MQQQNTRALARTSSVLFSCKCQAVPLSEDSAAYGSTISLIVNIALLLHILQQRLETCWNKRPAYSSANTGWFLNSSSNGSGKTSTSFDSTHTPLRQSKIPTCKWYIRFNQHLRKKGSICWPALAKTQTISLFLKWSTHWCNSVSKYSVVMEKIQGTNCPY